MKFLKTHFLEILIFVLFVLIRLPGLGHEGFNTDVWKWKSRIYDFGSGVFTLDFEKTIQKYHPGVTLMWLGSAGVKLYNFYYETFLGTPPVNNRIETVFELDFVQKLIIVLALGLTAVSVFYVLRKLFGDKYALIAILLISLEPFYVALTRVVHLEGLMSIFMIASFVWFYYYLKGGKEGKRHLKPLIISGIFTGLAVLTKTSALFMLPFLGLTSFLYEFIPQKNFKHALIASLKSYWKWLLVFLFTFVLLWPAMWTHTLLALETLYKGIFTVGVEGGHEQFYFNKFTFDPGQTYYFVVLALRSSIYLWLGLIGYIFISKKLPSDKKKFSFFVLLFALTYLIFLTIPSKKLDRYIIPTIISLLLVSGFFYEYILERIKKYWAGLLLLLMLPAIYILSAVHPDYFSYYNPMFGGLRTGINVIEPKWIIGAPEIVEYFEKVKQTGEYDEFAPEEAFDALFNSKKLGNRLVVGFDEKYYTQIWPYIQEINGRAVIQTLTPHGKVAKYFVYPIWDDSGTREDRFKVEKVDVIKVRGVPVYNVYKRVY